MSLSPGCEGFMVCLDGVEELKQKEGRQQHRILFFLLCDGVKTKLKFTEDPEKKMKCAMWICILIIFLSKSWSTTTGTNEITTVKPNSTSSPLKFHENRKEVFKLGSNTSLTCSKKTWNETFYVIWKIKLEHKSCMISFSNRGENIDECKDGKLLQNTSIGQSYLHIPNFSSEDVGIYTCESAYKGGTDHYNIDVALIVSPTVSVTMEQRNNTTVAVCRAEGGNPAANISWSFTGNSEPETSLSDSDGLVTVESVLKIPDGMNRENQSCIIQHPSWDQEKMVFLKVEKDFQWHWIFILIIGVVVLLVVGVSIFALKKIKLLRRCQQSDTLDKSPRTEDVEEVEPYASYVQRVNSIYN